MMRERELKDCISFEKFVDLFDAKDLQLQHHTNDRGWQRVCYVGVSHETMELKLGLRRYTVTDTIDLYDMYSHGTCILADFYFDRYAFKFEYHKPYLLDKENDDI